MLLSVLLYSNTPTHKTQLFCTPPPKEFAPRVSMTTQEAAVCVFVVSGVITVQPADATPTCNLRFKRMSFFVCVCVWGFREITWASSRLYSNLIYYPKILNLSHLRAANKQSENTEHKLFRVSMQIWGRAEVTDRVAEMRSSSCVWNSDYSERNIGLHSRGWR